ncbi:hypothetical protein ACHAQJ_007846 [Trichoderma viride]
MAASTSSNNLNLALGERPISRPTSRASTVGLRQGSTYSDNTEAMDLDDPVVTTSKAQPKGKRIDAPEVIELVEVEEDDTQEQLVTKLIDMVDDVTAEQLALNQPQITSAIHRLKELQDQQPPKVVFNPTIASSRRERLEGTLIYLTSELSVIPPANWVTYKKKLIKFSESELILNMTFAQRLYKVMDIMYLPEEMDAIPKEEFERLHSVARICATAAQAMGQDDEVTDALAEKWISAKVQDLAFLEKMFCSVRGIFKASAPEQTEMPWETQA